MCLPVLLYELSSPLFASGILWIPDALNHKKNNSKHPLIWKSLHNQTSEQLNVFYIQKTFPKHQSSGNKSAAKDTKIRAIFLDHLEMRKTFLCTSLRGFHKAGFGGKQESGIMWEEWTMTVCMRCVSHGMIPIHECIFGHAVCTNFYIPILVSMIWSTLYICMYVHAHI